MVIGLDWWQRYRELDQLLKAAVLSATARELAYDRMIAVHVPLRDVARALGEFLRLGL